MYGNATSFYMLTFYPTTLLNLFTIIVFFFGGGVAGRGL